MNKFEIQFKKIYETHFREMSSKLKEAQKLIDDVVKISEETGIPFRGHLGSISHNYFPMSFIKKYPNLDEQLIYDLTGTYKWSDQLGWQQSQIC